MAELGLDTKWSIHRSLGFYDLRNWSEQRHVLISPEEAGMIYGPEAIWDPEIGAYVVY